MGLGLDKKNVLDYKLTQEPMLDNENSLHLQIRRAQMCPLWRGYAK